MTVEYAYDNYLGSINKRRLPSWAHVTKIVRIIKNKNIW